MMRAISLWQPWASAIALGYKRVETRHWRVSVRGMIAIHAAKRWTLDERELHQIEVEAGRMPRVLPLGAVVAVADLVTIRRTEDLRETLAADERYWGNYSDGRFGWVFQDITCLPEPVPCRGMQGIFDLADEVTAAVLAQCAATARVGSDQGALRLEGTQ